MKFIQAKNFTVANRTKIDVICVHDMEYPERPGGAEWCAKFFAGNGAPQASAHFAVDSANVVQCVLEKDVAWHAPGANNNGIGVEHVGYAAQSRAEWLDDYSLAELKVSARLVAALCVRWSIPIVKLSPEDLKVGKRGICGHIDVTNAFSKGKGHYDPGPNFPWDLYLEWVREARVESPLDSPDKKPVETTTTSLRTIFGMQAALTQLGYDLGVVDGIRGPLTVAAIRRFQIEHGLRSDGIVGSITIAALERTLVGLPPMNLPPKE